MPLRRPINDKNLKYEIETKNAVYSRLRRVLTINDKNLKYEIETQHGITERRSRIVSYQ